MIRLAPNIGQNPRVLTSVNVMCIYANNLGGEVERGCVKQVDCRRAEHREVAHAFGGSIADGDHRAGRGARKVC